MKALAQTIRALAHWRPRGRRPVAALRMIDRFAAPLDDLLTLMLEQVNAGVLVMDRQGAIIRTNAILGRMLGHPATTGLSALQLFRPEERPAIWARLRAALLSGPEAGIIVATLVQNGAEAGLHVAVSTHVLREMDGAITGMLLRVTDTSVQWRLETQLAQSQKLQAVGQLAAGIAHDFNNLLTAVTGAADMIGARPGLDAQSLADVDEIRDSARRGGNLVRQLLAFGRQQSLRPSIVTINDALRDLSSLLARLLGSQIKLVLDLETPAHQARVLQTRVDPTQLDQVLVNLAVNARDAMPQGGTLTLRSGHITLHRPMVRGQETIPPGRYIMIEVRDTGAGIPAELLPRIFDPFFSTKRERGGTGLGLSTVHGIVRQSGGFLAVESELGTGTRLRIYLPRLDPIEEVAIPPAPSPVRPAAHPPPVAADRLVLLVDDEAPVRRLAERALVRAGWQVLAAESAEDALERLQERGKAGLPRPSLVISDIMMPGLDGTALVTRLREWSPGLPAILISGYADETLRSELLRSRVTFLAKPYGLSELVSAANAVASVRMTVTECE